MAGRVHGYCVARVTTFFGDDGPETYELAVRTTRANHDDVVAALTAYLASDEDVVYQCLGVDRIPHDALGANDPVPNMMLGSVRDGTAPVLNLDSTGPADRYLWSPDRRTLTPSRPSGASPPATSSSSSHRGEGGGGARGPRRPPRRPARVPPPAARTFHPNFVLLPRL